MRLDSDGLELSHNLEVKGSTPRVKDGIGRGCIVARLEDITDTCAGISGLISTAKSTSLTKGHFSTSLHKVVILKFKR